MNNIYFHHLITANTGNLNISKKFGEASWKDYESEHLFKLEEGKENIYKVHWQQMYARVRDGELKMLHHWNFVEQKTEDEDSIKTESGIFIKPEVEDITLHGNILHMNDWMEEQGVKVGDEVIFSENSEYEMTVEGERLIRSTFNLIVKAYLLPEETNSVVTNRISQVQKKMPPSRVVFGFEGDATDYEVGKK